MKIAELAFTISKNGGLKIPAATLQSMGLKPGDHVRVAYLTQDSQHNLYREFLLSSSSVAASTESQYISIPQALLEQANIADGEDIQIICLNGCVIFAQDAALSSQELLSVLNGLQIANKLAAMLPKDKNSVQQELARIIDTLGEEPI